MNDQTNNTENTRKKLRELFYEPLPEEALSIHPTKTFLTAIKPQYVYDRFNEAFGVGGWSVENELINIDYSTGMVIMKVVFKVPLLDIYYDCIAGDNNGGAGKKGFDIGDACKGATTDALGKIASWMGIGGDVYKGKQNLKETESKRPDNGNPWMNLNDKNWTASIKKGASLETVLKHFKMSKENQGKYREQLNK